MEAFIQILSFCCVRRLIHYAKVSFFNLKEEVMKIIIDVNGADDGIKIPIKASINALKEKEFVPVFAGDSKKIKEIIGSDISPC